MVHMEQIETDCERISGDHGWRLCDEAWLHQREACHEGDGVPQNDAQVICWWSRVAERGYQDAMYGLGCVYADNESVHKDYIKAYMWFNITNECKHTVGGRVLFNPSSDEQMGWLEPSITPEEISEAERLAREWIESHAS